MTDTPFLARPSIALRVEQLTKAIESEAEAEGDKFKALLVTVETAEKRVGVVVGCNCPVCVEGLARGAADTIFNASATEIEAAARSARVHRCWTCTSTPRLRAELGRNARRQGPAQLHRRARGYCGLLRD